MAKRYYTDEAYEQIKQTIEQIDNTDVSQVKDFFGDLFLRLCQFLKLFSVDHYQDDMQSWYNKVLDSHDTTLSKVDSIFNAVETVDFEYRDLMDGAYDSIVSFRSTLNCLRDVISGKTSLADGKTATAKLIASGKSSLNTSYEAIITKMERRVRREAGKELIGDILKLGGSFGKLLVPMGTAKKIAEYKKFADTITATLYDLGVVSSTILVPVVGGIGLLCGVKYENYLDFRYNQLIEDQERKDTNSMSDWLGEISGDLTEDLEKCPKDHPYYSVSKTAAKVSQIVSKGSDVVDVVVDAYDIGSDLKDTHDNIDEWINGKAYTEAEWKKVYDTKKYWDIVDVVDGDNGPIIKARGGPSEIILKVLSEKTGITFSGWEDPSKVDGNVWKTAGTLWSYAEKLLPDPSTGQSKINELPDVFFNKFKDTKFIKDVFDLVRDLDDVVTTPTFPDVNSGSAVGSADFRLDAIKHDLKLGRGVN